MRKKTLVIAGSATAAVLLLGGTGIAFAATDGFERSDDLSGSDLDRASEAAIAEVGGGSVTSAEKDTDGGITIYELDLIGTDGAEYDVTLDDSFTVLRVDGDDDRRGDDRSDDSTDSTGTTGSTGTGTGTGTDDGTTTGSTTVDPDDLVGEELQKASDAAIAAAGGGTVTDAERSDDADHAFDVEVRLADGSEVDVDLDASFGVISVDTDR